MANEVQVTAGLTISKGTNFRWNFSSGFSADMSGSRGPTPGAVQATVAGVAIDLSQLSVPGMAWVKNTDSTNYVTIGLKVTATDEFFPLLEIGPGQEWPVPFSRSILDAIYPATGTGTSAPVAVLYAKSSSGTVNLFVGAFER